VKDTATPTPTHTESIDARRRSSQVRLAY
jgi:hypothetical protein